MNMLATSYVLLLCAVTLCNGACQTPGNALCWLFDYDLLVGDPCCPGSYCWPWLGNYGASMDNWCQYSEPRKEGQFCGDRVGLCEDGLTCIENYCLPGTFSTNPTTFSTNPTQSTNSGQDCQKPGSDVGGAKCSYFIHGQDNMFNDPCCPGSECLAYDTPAVEPYFKYCMRPFPLQEGDNCANKVGKCGPGLDCNLEEGGVCKPEDGLGCQVPGNTLCRVLDGWHDVGDPCCDGSECLPWLYGTPHNFYCGKKDIEMGESCANKVGQCADGLDCIFGFCLPKTTTTTSTPTAPPGPCLKPGETGGTKCWDATDNSHTDCCSDSTCDFHPPNRPDDLSFMYCQYRDPIASGDPCKDKQGTCIGGQACDAASGTCP